MNEASRLINEFIRTYPITRYGKGQTLLRPGDEANRVYYVLEGTVVQYDISEAGNVLIVNSFLPGALLPMSQALNDESVDYFFEADSPVSARVAPREQAVEFIAKHPEVTLELLKRSYLGSDKIIRRLSYAMGGSATTRIIHELISTAERIGQNSSAGNIFIALSENDIAKRTGLSRETVNRMLRDFKTRGVVHATNQGIEISSLSMLRQSLNRD